MSVALAAERRGKNESGGGSGGVRKEAENGNSSGLFSARSSAIRVRLDKEPEDRGTSVNDTQHARVYIESRRTIILGRALEDSRQSASDKSRAREQRTQPRHLCYSILYRFLSSFVLLLFLINVIAQMEQERERKGEVNLLKS